ncbi:MAG: hypothetical protein AB1410_07630 [Acidobacteriota bacterium]
MILKSHLFTMIIYAALTSIVLSLIRKEGRERIKFGIILFLSLILGGIIFAWIMYPFPF